MQILFLHRLNLQLLQVHLHHLWPSSAIRVYYLQVFLDLLPFLVPLDLLHQTGLLEDHLLAFGRVYELRRDGRYAGGSGRHLFTLALLGFLGDRGADPFRGCRHKEGEIHGFWCGQTKSDSRIRSRRVTVKSCAVKMRDGDSSDFHRSTI